MEITTPGVLTNSGILAILVLWLVQWFVASMTKASQPGAIPGKIDEHLSHDSFVFRAHRTFMNSLETLPMFLGAAFLANFLGATGLWTGLLVWTFFLARLLHMGLYYAIATEQNPSPRSYAFMLGLLANIGVLVICLVSLI